MSKKRATPSASAQLKSKGQKDKEKILCPVCEECIVDAIRMENLAKTQFFVTAPVKLGFTGNVLA